MFCTKCGKEIHDEAVICVNCGCEVRQLNNNVIDEPSIVINVLSFCVPFIGLLLYAVWSTTMPRRANECGKWALLGFGVCILFGIIYSSSI